MAGGRRRWEGGGWWCEQFDARRLMRLKSKKGPSNEDVEFVCRVVQHRWCRCGSGKVKTLLSFVVKVLPRQTGGHKTDAGKMYDWAPLLGSFPAPQYRSLISWQAGVLCMENAFLSSRYVPTAASVFTYVYVFSRAL